MAFTSKALTNGQHQRHRERLACFPTVCQPLRQPPWLSHKLVGGCGEWREYYASKRPSVARETEKQGDRNSSEDDTLIPLATAKDIAFRGYDFILGLVEQLPKNAAAQCNPENPQIAFAVLKSRMDIHPLQCIRGVRRVVESRAAYLHGGKYGMIPRCVLLLSPLNTQWSSSL